jgi:hypothetical protein
MCGVVRDGVKGKESLTFASRPLITLAIILFTIGSVPKWSQAATEKVNVK